MYVLWFQRLFSYQMMFVSFNSKATKTTSGTRSAGPSRVRFRFQWNSYCSNFSFCVVFCDPFLISSYFFLLLYCLYFLDLQLLVALLEYVTLVDFVRSVWFSSSQRLLNYVAVHSVDLQKLVYNLDIVESGVNHYNPNPLSPSHR